jgi:hypothetical protein
LYPVNIKWSSSSNQLVISYHENPSSWPASWGWEVYKGDLIIDFRGGDNPIPRSIGFRYHDSNEFQSLDEGEDWIYTSPEQTGIFGAEARGRLATTRLERQDQHLLRCLLLSEYGACQITGTRSSVALEACHIVPVKNGGLDVIENALLLRRDLHSLFDAGLLRFKPSGDSWVIDLDVMVGDQQYRQLNGKPLMKAGSPSHAYLLARLRLENSC